ncbi:MAG: diaminopimelate epimerase [Clostridia bacterium]|nr:diaminopimelate epimerase [Clostridia bacterium]
MTILISACLLGLPCRYDGKAKSCPAAEELRKRHTLIPFCPECCGGLPTPREPSEIIGDRVISRSGRDVTAEYRRGAEEALALCRMLGCSCAVLKEKSPSCGHGQIYDGTFTGTLTAGDGITAALLAENGIPVYGESDIPDLPAVGQAYPFTKMHGIGNDYIYIDQICGVPVEDMASLAVRMSERRFSVGSDGVIYIYPPENPFNHGRMRMFNRDGSEGKMCGNGIRCVGKFLYDHGYLPADCREIRVETLAGVKTLILQTENGRCTGAAVDMGKAEFAPEKIPVMMPGKRIVDQPIEAAGEIRRITAVSMGNPHAVVFAEDIDALLLEKLGPAFEHHPLFPEGVNTEFVHVTDPTHLEMRVWERGSGETLACGTGACAAAAAAVLCGYCSHDTPVTVRLRGGCLCVSVDRDWRVTLEGPAETVYEGVWRP